jgi:hypothetical protein
MRKKYTMEEFRTIVDNAQVLALKKLSDDFRKAMGEHENKVDPLSELAFSMQNVLAMTELKRCIFGDDKDDSMR